MPSPTTATSAPVTQGVVQVQNHDRPIVYVNGRMLPKSQASVNVFDHGLLYGDGVFEGIRVYNRRIFKLKQHMDRIWASAESIKLKIHISRDEMIKLQRDCIEANDLDNGYIRLLVTRGVGHLGLNPYSCPTPGIICIADQIRLYPQELYEQGMKVVVAERRRVPVECLDPRIKSLNYLNNILAKTEALDIGLYEVVMLNMEDDVCEGSGDNIFIVKNGTVFTAPTDASLLEGVTRKFVLSELCPMLGIKSVERRYKLDDLLDADEVFLTGTAAEIIGVTEVQERASKGGGVTRISQGEGPITNKLRMKFREIVSSVNVPEE
ncbi:MAG: branched-chain-amino-acid transaminase [Phycisphaeraceae bacterium]|nr:branched-chain-amino-acid transaminase [Phycisphaeraceae bacterium]